jgi:hypothetical protein
VPENPTRADAEYAADILRELVADFHFAGPEHVSAWIALLLTLVARPAINGPVPAVIIDANVQGSGKTLLASLVAEIALGRELSRRTTPKDGAEWRKVIFAMARAGDPLILLDNAKAAIDSDALEAALTGTTVSERVLGTPDEQTLPWRTCLVITGNNAALSSDLVRRSLHVRLESRVERPDARTDFRHPDLLGYVREHRAELLGAALTIVRAYFAAGRPAQKMPPMGSFDAWSRIVRGAMLWAGCPDPLDTQAALRENADDGRTALEELYQAIHDRYDGKPVTAAQMVDDARADVGLSAAIDGICDGEPSAKRLGTVLRRFRGRILGGYVLKAGEHGKRGVPWTVTTLAPKPKAAPLCGTQTSVFAF